MKRDGHATRVNGKDVCVFCETEPPKKMSPENAAIYHGDIDGDFNY